MKKSVWTGLLLVAATLTPASLEAKTGEAPMTLWYDTPAKVWMESLPIGNGRLGAMTYGDALTETLALDESTMWSGQFNENQDKPFGAQRLKQLRELFFNGNLPEGNRIAGECLNGNQNMFGTHLPIGDMKIAFHYPENATISDYRRALSMDQAVSSVSYRAAGVKYDREYFSTNPDSVLVFRFTADRRRSITFDLSLDLKRQATLSADGKDLVFSGKVDFPMHGPGGVNFEGRIAVVNQGGTVTTDNSGIRVDKADAVTLIVDVRTDYKNPDYRSVCQKSVKAAARKSYKTLKRRHVADHAALFSRVGISLGDMGDNSVPADERWRRVRNGKSDSGLDALFLQYGRYLTIATSRHNSPLPIALQGFFNDNKACNMGWTNDYHLDINTQQNYWASNTGNLAECNAPLFTYLQDLARHGAKTARVVYGCGGWTAHTTANVWGYTAPSGSIYWGLFPTAGSWIATHLWTHYEYTQDKEYLARTAYPLLKGNARFLLDYMTTDPATGHLVTGPSISPENGFRYQGNEYCASMMPAVDRQLAYEILHDCVMSADILGIDKAFRDSAQAALDRLPPITLRANGAIREWAEDYDEAHPNHRHTSHLLALYPFAQITLDKTPELAEGARKTIEARLAAPNWEDTEWSRANMICLYARLKDADKAYESVRLLQGKLSRENLLTVSPGGIAGADGDIYAFDGNTAGTAGMIEMLVQDHEGYVEFLPCLPAQWANGHFRGICLRGGIEAAAEWDNSTIGKATLKATTAKTVKLKIPAGNYKISLNGKKIKASKDAKGIISLNLDKNDTIQLVRL